MASFKDYRLKPQVGTFKLSDNATVALVVGSDTQYYSYVGAVSTDAQGNVSGGGTQTGSYKTKKLALVVKNEEKITREYWFQLTEFDETHPSMVKQKFTARSPRLNPGEMWKYDLGYNPEPTLLRLDEFQIIDDKNNYTERHTPNSLLVDVLDDNRPRNFRAWERAKNIATLIGLCVFLYFMYKIFFTGNRYR